MKAALRNLSAFVGTEGFFVAAGTACLAVAAGIVHPAGPWAVIGAVLLLIGFALAWRAD